MIGELVCSVEVVSPVDSRHQCVIIASVQRIRRDSTVGSQFAIDRGKSGSQRVLNFAYIFVNHELKSRTVIQMANNVR